MRTKPKYRNRYDNADNVSSLHLQMGEVLNAGIFKHMSVFQEYPVSLINQDCDNKRLKVDWYIRELNAAIEVQGQQHYKPIVFGGTKEEAESRFVKQSRRDVEKTYWLEQAGCILVEVRFDETVNEEELIRRIRANRRRDQESSS